MDKQELIEKYEKLIQQNEPELEESKLAESRSKLYNNILRELKRMDDGITTEQAWEKIAEKFEEGPKELCATLVSALPPYNLSEKPEIPKFVADWIEEKRPYYSLITMVGNYLNGFGMPERLEEWITDNFNDYVKALVNGYTIEKQPVWIVKAPYDRYFGGFLEKGQHAEINFSHINKDNAQKFEDKSKAVAVATLVDGTVEEWSEKDEQ